MLVKPAESIYASVPGVTRQNNIRMNTMAIQVLTKTIYTDVILAIVRENVANALDATRAANSTTPPKITLPNMFQDNFKIRDYGIGLTADEGLTLLGDLFNSNKRTDAGANGCMGLGSKTPHAYTDTYYYKLYKDGLCSTMLRYFEIVDGERIPSSTIISTEETDEPNGVELQVPVDPKDNGKFADAVRKVMLPLKLLGDIVPEVPGCALPHISAIYQDEHCIITGPSPYEQPYSWDPVQVLMGDILYKVESRVAISGLNRESRLILKAPMGAVSFTASRERLETNKANIDWITSASAATVRRTNKIVKYIVDHASTMAGLNKSLDELNAVLGNVHESCKGLTFQGKPVRYGPRQVNRGELKFFNSYRADDFNMIGKHQKWPNRRYKYRDGPLFSANEIADPEYIIYWTLESPAKTKARLLESGLTTEKPDVCVLGFHDASERDQAFENLANPEGWTDLTTVTDLPSKLPRAPGQKRSKEEFAHIPLWCQGSYGLVATEIDYTKDLVSIDLNSHQDKVYLDNLAPMGRDKLELWKIHLLARTKKVEKVLKDEKVPTLQEYHKMRVEKSIQEEERDWQLHRFANRVYTEFQDFYYFISNRNFYGNQKVAELIEQHFNGKYYYECFNSHAPTSTPLHYNHLRMTGVNEPELPADLKKHLDQIKEWSTTYRQLIELILAMKSSKLSILAKIFKENL